MSEAPVSPADAAARITALEASLARANAALAARDLLIDTPRGQIARLRRMQFGASSEKLGREIEQLELALEELETERDAPVPEAADPGVVARPVPVRSLPGHLPREEVVHEPASGACTCPNCGGALRPLGSDAHERLDIVPVHWRVVRNVRPKYSCRVCEKIVQAPAPVGAVARGKATFATLAHVVVSKFDHHLPLYRQAGMMAAQGLDIDRSTLAGWTGQAAALLDPIVTRIRDEVLKADKIHADDTPVPVLDPGRGKTATGRLWVYAADDRASGSTAPRATWYRFTPDRTAAHPLAHLAGFRGFLQADAYAGYDGLYRGGVTEVACWAHFRRKVFDLHERSPTPLTTDILERVGALYAVETEVRGQPPDERCRARLEKSRPLVDALREVLDAALRRLSPKSDMARAIAYGTKRWPALSRFLDDGRLEIDNNIAERALRGLAVGRRNWLFAGSRAGGERAAAIYTVSRPARPTASTRTPTSPMSSPRSPVTGQPAAGTNSCRGTGCRQQIGQSRKPHNLRPLRSAYGRRPPVDLGNCARAEGRLPVVRLPCRLWAIHDDLQPFQPLIAPWLLARVARCAGGCWRGREEYRDRQHLHQGATRGLRRKRGRQIQAICRSRGGWTTKVHALSDVIGRPYALMLTAGNVSDVTAAPALLERAGRMRYLLADKGYDADRLRRSPRDAGTVPVIPGRRNRKRTIVTTRTDTAAAI